MPVIDDPAKRAMARAQGYSDAEIDAYLANKAAAQPDTTAVGGVSPLVPIGIVGGTAALGTLGVVKGVQALRHGGAQAVGTAMDVAGELPGVGRVVRGARMLARMGGGAPPEATAAPPPTAEPPRLPPTLTLVTPEDIAAHPELKNFQPGQTITRKTLEAIKLEQMPGSVQSRTTPPPIIKIVNRKGPGPSGQEEPYQPGPGAGRGASAAELARRAEARTKLSRNAPADATATRAPAAPQHEVQYYSEGQGKFVPIEDMHISHLRNAYNKLYAKLKATGTNVTEGTITNPNPNSVTQKQFEAVQDEINHRLQKAGELTVPGPTAAAEAAVPKTVTSSDLEDQLSRSLQAVKAIKSAGLAPAEESAVMSALREAVGGPEMQAIMLIMGAKDIGSQGPIPNVVRENLLKHMSPSARRALTAQQGS